MLSRLYPTEPLRSFDQVNKMMERMLGNGSWGVWTPAVDVKETKGLITLNFELPGIEEKDIEIELVGDVLTIRGQREFSKEEKKEDYVLMERSYGTFQRSFTLDAPTKLEDIKANFKDGILTVTVPKTTPAPRQKVLISHN